MSQYTHSYSYCTGDSIRYWGLYLPSVSSAASQSSQLAPALSAYIGCLIQALRQSKCLSLWIDNNAGGYRQMLVVDAEWKRAIECLPVGCSHTVVPRCECCRGDWSLGSCGRGGVWRVFSWMQGWLSQLSRYNVQIYNCVIIPRYLIIPFRCSEALQF